MNKPRYISIFGSTGSIGVSTLDIVRSAREEYAVAVLTAHNNWQLLAEQAREFKPQMAVIANDAHYENLKSALAGENIAVAAGEKALLEAAQMPSDIAMAALVGFAGLAPTLMAAKHSRRIALANKESLVCAGSLLIEEAARHGTEILPADSEHAAVHQLMQGYNAEDVESITLTASGGPFRTFTAPQLERATVESALRHPVWKMGRKISIDSATLLNKGLEIIEAHYLFNLKAGQIEVLIHPEVKIHAFVSYKNGMTLAQFSPNDMRHPISYALDYPRIQRRVGLEFSLQTLSTLNFEEPRHDLFPLLKAAQDSLAAGPCGPVALNAANEVAVDRFLAENIGFMDISHLVLDMLNSFTARAPRQGLNSLQDIAAFDAEVRHAAKGWMPKRLLSAVS